jgi:trimeric autotransporter adhesin
LQQIVLTSWRDFFQTQRRQTDLKSGEERLSRSRFSPFQTCNRRVKPTGKKERIHPMKTSIQRNSIASLLLIPLVLACFGLSQTAQAVTPAPDGGYPDFNTAEGDDALFSLTTGADNTAVGFAALGLNLVGSDNTAVGAAALLNNTASNNTAIGSLALFNNTDGTRNTATGFAALFSNTTVGVNVGSSNTAFGFEALVTNTTGFENTAVGSQALRSNATTSFNTAVGNSALQNSMTINNTAVGWAALQNTNTGGGNTATGSQALLKNEDGGNNVAIGLLSLFSNIHGVGNTAVGTAALANNLVSNNTAVGVNALASNTSSSNNTAVGANALASGAGGPGSNNTAVGNGALQNVTGVGVTTGHHNIALGNGAGSSVTTGSNNIDIGNNGAAESGTIRIGSADQTATFMAGISGVNEGSPAAVFINTTTGQLGTTPPASSRRFKKEIKPMNHASEAILGFKPVTFQYKSDTTGTPQFGLIAEEVAAVNPDLVIRDEKGDVYSVRYDAVNAMLLNEFLKEHRKNEEQEKTIAELKCGMTALAATVKEQASQIQKVSAQLEMSKTAPQVVGNNR